MANHAGNDVRKSCDRNLLEPRISKTIATSSLMKVRWHRLENELKRTCKITSRLIINCKLYDVTISNTPSCTCSDYKNRPGSKGGVRGVHPPYFGRKTIQLASDNTLFPLHYPLICLLCPPPPPIPLVLDRPC